MIQQRFGDKEQYICYLLFILDPIITWLGVPGHFAIISSIFVLFGLYYSLSKDFRDVLASKSLVIWMILTLYHCFNGMVKGIYEVDFIDVLHGLKIYFCIAIFVYWAQIDLLKTYNILYRCFFFYLMVCFFVCGGLSLGNGRLSGAIYSTQLGQAAAITAFYGAALYFLKSRTVFVFGGYLFLPFVIALLTQTRNAIAMIVIIVVGAFCASRLKTGINVYNMIKMIGAVLVSLALIAVVVVNSPLYQRAQKTPEAHLNSYYMKNNYTGSLFDKIVGDRLIYYVEGWKLFKTNPITGIGMWGFQQKYGGVHPLHSEYMIHLCEGGVVGFSLWVLFLCCCVKNMKTLKLIPGYRLLLFFGLFEFLFCGIYAREFYYEFFYPLISMFLVNFQKIRNQFIVVMVSKNDESIQITKK